MKRPILVTIIGLLLGPMIAMKAVAQQTAAVVDVYKSPTCGCCTNWIEHMRRNGFTVRATLLADGPLATFKATHGVPGELQSCHTALVNGYVVEGHVPAADVRRLLNERLPLLGIAVPGMPRGTPGMEAPGAPPQPYSVIAFDKQGNTRTFARRRG